MEDILLGGVGKMDDGWESVEESLVVTEDRSDGRLLKHDLRDPNAVGVSRFSPWKIASVLSVPREQVSA